MLVEREKVVVRSKAAKTTVLCWMKVGQDVSQDFAPQDKFKYLRKIRGKNDRP